MNTKSILLLFLGILIQNLFAQDHIYNATHPEIVPIWHRVADYSPQLRSVEAVELSPDGRLAISASKFGYNLMLWRVADGDLIWENKHESEIECVTFSPDGKFIASGGEDFFVRIWDVASGKEIRSMEHDSGLDGITWSHDGRILVAGSESGDAWFWNSENFDLIGKVNVGSTINSLDFTQNDKQLVIGGNIQTPDPKTGKTIYHGFVKRLDVAKQEVIREYKGHTASVKSVRLSPDEKLIASGGFDNTARLYDFESGKLLHTFEEPLRVEAVAFTKDGHFLLTGGHQKKISFYRISDFQLAYELPSPRTEYLHFSSDGRLLVSGHEDSGLISLYMMLSDTQHRQGVYHRLADAQLNNRDLKKVVEPNARTSGQSEFYKQESFQWKRAAAEKKGMPSQTLAQNPLPNIVLILADDLGYGDLGCYGAKDIRTPVLDQLAAEGVKLTTFYANGPECTPTRTALLTGRYQQRVGGLECAIGLGNIGRYEESKKLSDQGELGLPVSFNALPQILLKKGYNTALIGKWHLGDGKFNPKAHGFDYSIGPLGGAVDYFHHTEPIGEFIGTYMEGDRDFYRNNVLHDRAGYYMTHLITDEAVEWLNHQQEAQPFFLYLPYTTPHQPLQAPNAYQKDPITMEHWRDGDRKDYAAMVEDMDKGIGRILKKLKEKGFDENTIIIFFSDNGPAGIGSAGSFRGNKGHVFEGGIRVPCIIRWPEKIDANTTNHQSFMSMDITASIATIIEEKPERGLDGIDMIGQIIDGNEEMSRNLFWRKKRGNQVRSAVRAGNLKYIRAVDTNVFEEYLFDLSNDPQESRDLKDSQSGDLKKMQTLLSEWERDVKAERYE